MIHILLSPDFIKNIDLLLYNRSMIKNKSDWRLNIYGSQWSKDVNKIAYVRSDEAR